MRHYVIYDTVSCKFLRVSNSREGYVDSHDWVEDVDDSTTFIYNSDDFERQDFVTDLLRYLKAYSDFNNVIFCECEFSFDDSGTKVLSVSYEFPILVGSDIYLN